MPQLTHLHLEGFEKSLESTSSAQAVQQLLVVLDGMLQLKLLHIDVRLVGVRDATLWSALVASTQLTYLNYDGPSPPSGAC
jgi:hypothetical protein